jgi:polyphosphate kinase
LKSGLLDLIEGETEKALNGEPALIIAKMNSLTDLDVIDSLTKAAKVGVQVTLIVRGVCCLNPMGENKTNPIRVISIVGRFLEHSRIYCFGSRENPVIYISSADMMTRNTEKRVEIAVPILSNSISQRIYDMLMVMLKDNVKARVLKPDGTYEYNTNDEEPFDSQIFFLEEAYQNSY